MQVISCVVSVFLATLLAGCATEPMSAIWYNKKTQTLKSPGDQNIVVSRQKNSIIAIQAYHKNLKTHYSDFGVPIKLVVINASANNIYFDLSDIKFQQEGHDLFVRPDQNTSIALVTESDISEGLESKSKRMAFLSALGAVALGAASAKSKNPDPVAIQNYMDASSKMMDETTERAIEDNIVTANTLFRSKTIGPKDSANGVIVIKNVDQSRKLRVFINIAGDLHYFSLSRQSVN